VSATAPKVIERLEEWATESGPVTARTLSTYGVRK
jgi:hypothetical protein